MFNESHKLTRSILRTHRRESRAFAAQQHVLYKAYKMEEKITIDQLEDVRKFIQRELWNQRIRMFDIQNQPVLKKLHPNRFTELESLSESSSDDTSKSVTFDTCVTT